MRVSWSRGIAICAVAVNKSSKRPTIYCTYVH